MTFIYETTNTYKYAYVYEIQSYGGITGGDRWPGYWNIQHASPVTVVRRAASYYDPYAWRFCDDHIQHPVLIPASQPRVEAAHPHHLIHVSVSARRRAIRKRFVHKLRRAS